MNHTAMSIGFARSWTASDMLSFRPCVVDRKKDKFKQASSNLVGMC